MPRWQGPLGLVFGEPLLPPAKEVLEISHQLIRQFAVEVLAVGEYNMG